MPEDPYSDPVTGVLFNKLGLGTAAELEAAEREITHAALILLRESPVSPTVLATDEIADPSADRKLALSAGINPLGLPAERGPRYWLLQREPARRLARR
jgi:hypothetical protein